MMPVMGCNGLDLLALRLDIGSDLEQEMSACLSEDEHQRAKCLAQVRDRRRFVARRSYLRHILASRLGISPAEVELEYGPQGKPRLSHRMPMQELHFGMTRSEELAIVALSNTGEIGVDIEAIRPVAEAEDIAALCFSPPEYESFRSLAPEDRVEGFFRHWTRLEAISKAIGCGLAQPIPSDDGEWETHTFVPEPGYIGTVVFQK
ncbi:4'-phosphopantetheinyl transferase family protein [Microvirga lotononidis]|uniref:Phosphopantetheinyl transferase n=1 Tax=Microvirga lotononidis TaxID=864069 RepID=I4YYB2_9HYPH|nr:4'-phosphopantetheinyl transferase superfamily protein [Microvirga lotononidis]EIM28954.1 phosphopantetheinyl transferase [Microvirga lotononidis]WQO26872.1 4'-phosphopantetheinyl transferase superfamily protein [Microvirga lotononidis]